MASPESSTFPCPAASDTAGAQTFSEPMTRPVRPRIRVEVKSNAFRFLWLKAVSGFVESQHCARCLGGKYMLFPYGQKRAGETYEQTLESEAPFFYLCGVTPRYATNVHVPFAAQQGGLVTYEDSNIRVTITDARALTIPALPAHVSQTLHTSYATCRNFQFGYAYLRP